MGGGEDGAESAPDRDVPGRKESLHSGSWRGGQWRGGQMLRGSWDPCQQMGPPESLTKPTNPSQAGQGEGPESLIPPYDLK